MVLSPVTMTLCYPVDTARTWFKTNALLLTICAIALMAPTAQASLAFNFVTPTAGDGGNTPAESLGYEFTTGADILEVTALGFYDFFSAGAGLAADHEVGIFDTSGDLLVSAIVLTTDPITDSFNYDTLETPFELSPNSTYIVAAETGPSGSDIFVWSPTGSFDPEITFVTDLFTASPSLTLPGTTDSNIGLFGPNFEFTATTPEPTPALLVGAALLMLALRRSLTRS